MTLQERMEQVQDYLLQTAKQFLTPSAVKPGVAEVHPVVAILAEGGQHVHFTVLDNIEHRVEAIRFLLRKFGGEAWVLVYDGYITRASDEPCWACLGEESEECEACRGTGVTLRERQDAIVTIGMVRGGAERMRSVRYHRTESRVIFGADIGQSVPSGRESRYHEVWDGEPIDGFEVRPVEVEVDDVVSPPGQDS